MLSLKKNTEGESELKNRIFGHPAASKKRWDICKTFFQTLDAIFSYKRVFFTNVQKANIIAFSNTIFLAPILSVKNTLFTFFLFFPLCMHRFVKTFSSSNFWGVKKAPCKKFHVFRENWQRNHFPKLTTLWLILYPMLQLSHSAMEAGGWVSQNVWKVKSNYLFTQ